MSTIIKCCPKCGDINYYNGDVCGHCKVAGYNTKYVDTKYEFTTMSDWREHKDEISEAIYQEYVYNNPLYDKAEFNARIKEEEQIAKESLFSSRPKESNAVTCPYCKSTNVTKISTAGRVVSVGLFGLGSSKVGKQWHCNNCKSDF